MDERERMISVRKSLGLTQTQWGTLLGKSLTTITTWENRCPIISQDVRYRLKKIGINSDYPIFGRGDITISGVTMVQAIQNAKNELKIIESCEVTNET